MAVRLMTSWCWTVQSVGATATGIRGNTSPAGSAIWASTASITITPVLLESERFSWRTQSPWRIRLPLQLTATTTKRFQGNEDMKALSDTDPMPFGKHKGEPMQDVPASYFHYLWHNGLREDKQSNVAAYIRRNLNALRQEHPDGFW